MFALIPIPPEYALYWNRHRLNSVLYVYVRLILMSTSWIPILSSASVIQYHKATSSHATDTD